MIGFFRTWLLGMIGAALFCAAASELTPKGTVKNVQRTLCGMVLAAAMLLPLLQFDFGAYAAQLALLRRESAALGAGAEERAQILSRTIIEDELEAYILDKAQTLGAAVDGVSVSARWSTEGVWVPVAVTLDGPYSAALADVIEGELGIPASEQSWRTDEST